MKKYLISLLLVASLFAGQAFAATTIQAPAAVGTYVDFYHDVRLQIKPVSGAVAYKVYLANGYNAKTSFVLKQTITNPIALYINRQHWIQTAVSTPKIQWYTIRVTTADRYGHESAPFTTSVNVWR